MFFDFNKSDGRRWKNEIIETQTFKVLEMSSLFINYKLIYGVMEKVK